MKLIAIDPGGTTGFCTVASHGGRAAKYLAPLIRDRGQLEPFNYPALWRLLGTINPERVITERFENTGNPAANLAPCEVNGILRLWCQMNRRAYIEQKRSDGKAFWTDTKLKEVGLYIPGRPHANDATRHMLHYVTFRLHNQHYVNLLRPSSLEV